MGFPTTILATGLLVLFAIVCTDAFVHGYHGGYHNPDYYHGGYRGGYHGGYPGYRRGYRSSSESSESRDSSESSKSSESSESRGSSESSESSESREKSDSRRSSSGGDTDHKEETRYRFQIGSEFGPYEYIDDDGVRRGFHVDLLRAVCAEAGKKCNWLLDRYTNCWDNGRPGVGLLGDWYDACMGVYPTPERINSFNFSAPFTTNFHMTLHYKRGGSAQGHALDLTGRKIGFVHGWSMSPACIARQASLRGNLEIDYTPVYFETEVAMIKALQEEEIDAIIGMPQYIPASMGLMSVGSSFYCTDAGTGLMTRYSNQGILDWWNEAFERMQQNGDFKRLCEKAQKEHGHRGTIHCIE